MFEYVDVDVGRDGSILKSEEMEEACLTWGSLTLAVPKFQRKKNKITLLKGAMSRRHCCLRSTIMCRSHYLGPLPIHKMLLKSYEEDIKFHLGALTIILLYCACV